jgi:hypothetical protein
MKVLRNFHFSLWNIMWAIATLAMAYTSNAQSISGRWRKVALPQPDGGANDNTLDFSFIDSSHGIWLSDYGLISYTSDGGRSWVQDTNLNTNIGSKFNFNSVVCSAPLHGFFQNPGVTLSITPGGTSFSSLVPNVNELNYGAYATLAEKMYDTAYGFRLVEYVSPEALDQYQDSVPILVTHDGWHSSSLYGSAYILFPDSNLAEVSSVRMPIGRIIDSNNIWAMMVSESGATFDLKSDSLIHTSNGGTSWETLNVLDSMENQTLINDLFVNPSTHELLYMGNFGNVDFAYSSDYGTTWRLDSTFGVHLWRIANPAPGILWGMIGQSGSGQVTGYVQIRPPENTFGTYYENDYSRKIAYSSDTGHTWTIDSITFINDSLEEMHFIDARHGWIASWSNDSIFMWYYDADESSVGEAPVLNQQLQIYPNPFSQSTQITFTSPSAGYAEVSIVNMLGVEVARLFSGELGAGEHSFVWDAGKDACTTDTYECLVRMNGQVETLPVVLMR